MKSWSFLKITLMAFCFLILITFSETILSFHLPLKVSIKTANQTINIKTFASTVAGALKSAKIPFSKDDILIPSGDTKLYNGMEIKVVKVSEKIIPFRETFMAKSITIPSPYLNYKEVIEVEAGKPGIKEVTVKIKYHDGVEIKRETLKEKVIRKPKRGKQIRGIGKQTRSYMLTKPMKVKKTLWLLATAYYPGPEDNAPHRFGETATGLRAGYGIAAVDPEVISLGTRLYICGYGYAIAADTGGDIKGNRIDLCFNDIGTANMFGRKKVKVYVLK